MHRKSAIESPQDASIEKAIQREPIAIIGIGCRFPGGANSPEQLWSLLRNGTHVVSEIPSSRMDVETYFDPRPGTPGKMMTRWGGFLEDIDQFDASFFGIAPREAARLDPQQRLLLEVAWEALEDAGQLPAQLASSLTGVFVGLWLNDFESRLYADPSLIDFYMTTGSGRYSASGRLSYFLGLQGPSLTIDTACSSSLVAVHLACQSLWSGESSLALAGGANVILQPHISIAYSRSKMMAADGRCKFGDAQADGYVRSEGAALVVLKRLSQAIDDGDPIYAVIRGSAVNNDGQSSGFLATPGQQGQEEMLRLAYRRAGVDPGEVQYVEAHGTGTRAGDPVELGALGTVLGKARAAQSPLLVGSIKTNFGHTEGAAGIAGLIKVALSIKNGAIPPSLHLGTRNSAIPWQELNVDIPTALTPWQADKEKIAGVSAFGIVGTNAHIVLAEAPQNPQKKSSDATTDIHVLPLSAQTPGALRALAQSFVTLLNREDLPALQDLCYTMSCRRAHHAERLTVAGRSPRDLADQLTAYLQQQTSPQPDRNSFDGQAKVVFVFPGQGAQWLGMGRELFAQNPVFRETLSQCDVAIRKWADWSLLEQLRLDEDSPDYRLAEISVIQPVLFAMEVALAAVWRAWGIEPSAVIGHSMGEVAAAYVAGALSLEDAAHVICKRSQLMQRTSGQGAMALIGLPLDASEAMLKPYENKLSVAVQNSPRSTVISGDPVALEEVMSQLQAQGTFCRYIKVDVASHSPQMEPLRPELVEALAGLRPASCAIPFYSTVIQDVCDGASLDAGYWGSNLRQPVRFMETIQRLLESEHTVFIELSPHPILLSAIEEISHFAGKPGYGIASLRREQPELLTMLAELGSLYKLGYSVDWSKFHPSGGNLVSVPAYPWQRERYWFEAAQATNGSSYLAGKIEHPLLGYRLPSLAHLAGHFVWQNKWGTLQKQLSARKSDLDESTFREMALAAANLALGSTNHLIRAVTVAEPLPKENDGDLTLQATLVQNDATATFELFSRASETSDWQRHFHADIKVGGVDSRWFYDLVWQTSDLTSQVEDSLANSNWLIFADQLGLGQEFVERLQKRGAACTVVHPGIDFDSLFDGLKAEPAQIVYLWGTGNGQLTVDGLSDQSASAESLITLVQAVLRRNGPSNLFVVTQGAQTVTTDAPELASAPLWGLGRVLALEHPELLRRLIDLPVGESVASLADTLWLEVQQQDAEDQVVYRNGQRYVPRLVPATPSGSEARALTIAPDKTYLITGGLGTLGLQLSRWLADQGARHLVLTSRTGLPEQSQWSSIAADTPAGQRIAALRALQERGVQVTVAKADASDHAAMQQLFAQFGAALPPLQGVIHAAGTNANQPLADMDMNTWHEVLKPKVEGAWVLHNLTANLPLDFFVSFSSAASVWGAQGMAAYAAANHFLDQLAYYRRSHGLPALTVNWGWWAGDGIATAEQLNLFAKVGMSTMPADKALAALTDLLERNATQAIVADVDWTVFAPIYASRRERPFLSRIQIPVSEKTAKPESETKTEKNSVLQQLQALTSLEKQREMLTDFVRQTTAEVMGFDKSRVLNTREGFFKMGMDSLMTVQLRTRLESALSCSLPPTIAFEYPTIHQLVSYLLQDVLHLSQKAAAEPKDQPATPAPDPELASLSDENLLDLLDDELARVDDLTK